MAKSTAEASQDQPVNDSYWQRSQLPLQALVFLLPLIVFYEISLFLLGTDEFRRIIQLDRPPGDIKAHRLLFDFFEWMGVSGYYLPGLLLVAVLLSWHVLRRDAWQFDPQLYLFMWIESLVLALPLFVFGWVLSRQMQMMDPALTDGLAAIVMSVGAGVYEELLFRLIGLALLHMILTDWMRMPSQWGAVCAIGTTAVAFAFYHFSHSRPFQWGLFIFYSCAGIYFAGIYLARGFGIVAWTHALYDLLVTLLKMQQHFDDRVSSSIN